MKVAFVSRDTLFSGKGGDTIQILKTAEYLQDLGVEVDIFKASEKIDYEQYDILHGFNVIRPADLIDHFENFKGIKVLSTIYVDFYEYELKARKGVAGMIFRTIGKDATEYLKACLRWVKNRDHSLSRRYLFHGHRKCVKKLIKLSDLLLPNSHSEYKRLSNDYSVSARYHIVPNAIDPKIFSPVIPSPVRNNRLVICVARIEGPKNQLNLIRALNNTGFELILIGKPAPNHLTYYEQCRTEAASNVSFVSDMPQEDLINYYQTAQVHAMPSWFETTGLSSLEAAAMGCNLVISAKGDTREYFGEHATYANPEDVQSIFNAVNEAAKKPFDEKFRNKIYSEYIWEKTAAATLAAYKTCLNKSY